MQTPIPHTTVTVSPPKPAQALTAAVLARYFLVGLFFGLVLIKSEVVSWFRIQEMFRFQSFHMYGVIGSAVVTGMLGVLLLKRLKLKTLDGEAIAVPRKRHTAGNVIGGLLFGVGWAITGACPGPLFALVGTGAWTIGIALLAAIAGTWTYGRLHERLP